MFTGQAAFTDLFLGALANSEVQSPAQDMEKAAVLLGNAYMSPDNSEKLFPSED